MRFSFCVLFVCVVSASATVTLPATTPSPQALQRVDAIASALLITSLPPSLMTKLQTWTVNPCSFMSHALMNQGQPYRDVVYILQSFNVVPESAKLQKDSTRVNGLPTAQHNQLQKFEEEYMIQLFFQHTQVSEDCHDLMEGVFIAIGTRHQNSLLAVESSAPAHAVSVHALVVLVGLAALSHLAPDSWTPF